jgi:hypothetical protein
MCQAYEGEARSIARGERHEISEAWRKHQSGERRLTDAELRDLVIQRLMLDDAGYWWRPDCAHRGGSGSHLEHPPRTQ